MKPAKPKVDTAPARDLYNIWRAKRTTIEGVKLPDWERLEPQRRTVWVAFAQELMVAMETRVKEELAQARIAGNTFHATQEEADAAEAERIAAIERGKDIDLALQKRTVVMGASAGDLVPYERTTLVGAPAILIPGAVGDGVADDTAAVQAAISGLAPPAPLTSSPPPLERETDVITEGDVGNLDDLIADDLRRLDD